MSYVPDLARSTTPAGITAHPGSDVDNDEHTRNVMAFLHPTPPNSVNMGNRQNTVDIMKILLGQDVRTTVSCYRLASRFCC